MVWILADSAGICQNWSSLLDGAFGLLLHTHSMILVNRGKHQNLLEVDINMMRHALCGGDIPLLFSSIYLVSANCHITFLHLLSCLCLVQLSSHVHDPSVSLCCSDSTEVMMHSNDAFAPVAYLRMLKLHLKDKVSNVCFVNLKGECPSEQNKWQTQNVIFHH